MNNKRLPFTILKGGSRTLLMPVLHELKLLSSETQTIPVRVNDVVTKSGVPLNVDLIAQVKIRTDVPGLIAAGEQLLGKTPAQIREIAQENLEGQIRSACARLEVEVINHDRDQLSSIVLKEAAQDLAKLGLELTTFTVKDVSDKNGYLKAMGEKRTADKLAEARIGKAQAERDAEIKVAELQREREAAKAEQLDNLLTVQKAQASRDGKVEEAARDAEIAEANRDRDVRVEGARLKTDQARADADVAYSVQKTKAEQALADRQKELAAKQADAEKERQRQNVVVPAEAAAQAVAAQAAGKKEEALRQAEAEAEAIRLKGVAEAEAIKLKGMAEAEALEAQAAAYAKFGSAALADRLAAYTPQIAEAIAKSLENTEKIVVLEGNGDGNSLTNWVTNAAAAIPAALQGVTGQNLLELIADVSKAARTPPGTSSAV